VRPLLLLPSLLLAACAGTPAPEGAVALGGLLLDAGGDASGPAAAAGSSPELRGFEVAWEGPRIADNAHLQVAWLRRDDRLAPGRSLQSDVVRVSPRWFWELQPAVSAWAGPGLGAAWNQDDGLGTDYELSLYGELAAGLRWEFQPGWSLGLFGAYTLLDADGDPGGVSSVNGTVFGLQLAWDY